MFQGDSFFIFAEVAINYLQVLAILMLAPRSCTQEEVVELQCHGNDVCLHRLLMACLEAGASLAERSEFILRAFLNRRLDLSQAENIGRIISAKSVATTDLALVGIHGGFSSLVQSLKMQCIELLAEIEAHLDFNDELPFLNASQVEANLGAVYVNEPDLKEATTRAMHFYEPLFYEPDQEEAHNDKAVKDVH